MYCITKDTPVNKNLAEKMRFNFHHSPKGLILCRFSTNYILIDFNLFETFLRIYRWLIQFHCILNLAKDYIYSRVYASTLT